MASFSKIAILGTSQARKVQWNGNDIESARASDRLLELLDNDYTVYIASTRTKLYPEYDSCVTDLIPSENIFTANPELGCADACSPGLIDLWLRALKAVGVDAPNVCNSTTWLDLRYHAKSQGIAVE